MHVHLPGCLGQPSLPGTRITTGINARPPQDGFYACKTATTMTGSMATPRPLRLSLQQPAHEYTRLLQTNQLTSQDLIAALLDQIDHHNHDGIKVNAILSICPRELALARACQLDEERRQGKVRSDLHGMPIVLKVAQSRAAQTFPSITPKHRSLTLFLYLRMQLLLIRLWAWSPRPAHVLSHLSGPRETRPSLTGCVVNEDPKPTACFYDS